MSMGKIHADAHRKSGENDHGPYGVQIRLTHTTEKEYGPEDRNK